MYLKFTLYFILATLITIDRINDLNLFFKVILFYSLLVFIFNPFFSFRFKFCLSIWAKGG